MITAAIFNRVRLPILSLMLPLFVPKGVAVGCPVGLLLPGRTPIEHVTQVGPHHLHPIATYDDVERVIRVGPYPYEQLPIIPIVNFDFRTGVFEVGNRSRDILVERDVFSPIPEPKPIHPMGIGIQATMEFFAGSSPYSGVFRGGRFPVQGRFSISQGNPTRFEERRSFPVFGRRRLIPQVRSTTMGLLLFDPAVPRDQASPIVSLVLQDDLNGKLDPVTGESPYVLEQTVFNKPVFDPKQLLDPKLARLYHYGTLAGVIWGARQSPFERVSADPYGIESTTLGVNALLRPPHGFANFGETDPARVNPPVWLRFVPRLAENPEVVRADDFRKEVYETLLKGPIVYDIDAGHEFDQGSQSVVWRRVGEFRINRAFLPSVGADQILRIQHADTAMINYFTGQSITDLIRLANEANGLN